jgi:hypothetical protein
MGTKRGVNKPRNQGITKIINEIPINPKDSPRPMVHQSRILNPG